MENVISRLQTIIESAKANLATAIMLDGRPDKEGCYLCVFYFGQAGEALRLVMRIGTVSDSAAIARYSFNCEEKCLRSLAHPDHVSSWQTRSDVAGQYGGGVNAEGNIAIGLSGFKEHVDEALSSMVAFDAGIMSEERWRQIAAISQNPHMVVYGQIQ